MTQTRYLWTIATLVTALVAAFALALASQAATAEEPSGTITPSEVNLTLKPGESALVPKKVHLDALPSKADIVLAIDTTGSMGGAIDDAQTEANQLVTDLTAAIPGARFAVVDFKDYPLEPYGSPGFDYPYKLKTTGLTNDSTAIKAAIDSLSAAGGFDFPESYNRVFYEAYSDTELKYDPEAEKFLVVLGDAPPHDPDQTVAPACGNQPPVDPGRDGVPGTSDDLQTEDTIKGLSDNNITMLMIQYNPFLPPECYQQLTAPTGGSAVAAGSGGDLSKQIVDFVKAKSSEIKAVDLQLSEGCKLNVSTNPPSPLGPFTAPTDFSFDETISVPTDATPGTTTCQLKVLADGAERATQTINVTVEEANKEVPVDIKPTSCPNPLNVGKNGVLPAAILGTKDFDATQVKPESVKLEGVSPVRTAQEDVAALFTGTISDPPKATDCTTVGRDGFKDLTLKFDAQKVVDAANTSQPITDKEVRVLHLTGELNDGTKIEGKDVVVFLKK